MKVTLTITQDEKGQVLVTGPIDHRSICYALLECARDVIKDHCDKRSQSSIVTANTLPGGSQFARHAGG
jgi:hypothetical protein